VAQPAQPRRVALRIVLLFAAGVAITLLGYLAGAVPGSWFPSVGEHFWTARDLHLARGQATLANGEWVVQTPDANALVVLSGDADLRSTDYRALSWIAAGVPPNADVRVLWRSDYEPGKLNSARVVVESGRLRPVIVDGDPAWIGRVTGVALALRGPFVQPVRIRGAVAQPMGAVEVLRDRAREWFAFEGWTGTSINTIVGGADVQDLPLTWVIAIAMALAIALFFALRWRSRPGGREIAAVVALLTLCGWLVLDGRWAFALARQSIATGRTYGGLDSDQRHRRAEDAQLYDLVQRARALMPPPPLRVFVAAEAHYFRGRAAYHFYPYNVYFDPRNDTVAAASQMHAGDWLFVYQRPGIQFDRANNMLRWDGGQTHAAELMMVQQGAALFKLL
jgi:hypothetical protein